jgi:hypothetical protein
MIDRTQVMTEIIIISGSDDDGDDDYNHDHDEGVMIMTKKDVKGEEQKNGSD